LQKIKKVIARDIGMTKVLEI